MTESKHAIFPFNLMSLPVMRFVAIFNVKFADNSFSFLALHNGPTTVLSAVPSVLCMNWVTEQVAYGISQLFARLCRQQYPGIYSLFSRCYGLSRYICLAKLWKITVHFRWLSAYTWCLQHLPKVQPPRPWPPLGEMVPYGIWTPKMSFGPLSRYRIVRGHPNRQADITFVRRSDGVSGTPGRSFITAADAPRRRKEQVGY